ncbi:2-amino-4-hydroxy-6-hydroxymethyldihydropteridine diphosphokinase [Hyphobacterium sp.]|uniref:2-amino-4-hydroxy-6- hydroxymethyldihydropteridine diphosphokinase n=1 Tax=Hyphobacterium sp. TaxID=2004662 RepID=UPI003BAD37C2
MSAHSEIFVGLGGNLPFQALEPQETLTRALQLLKSHGVRPVHVSSFWISPAWPDPSKPAYTNAVAEVETALDPLVLLETLHMVESALGRVRVGPNSSRTLDLDLIDYRGQVLDTKTLTLPHQRAHERAFVLLPLQELAANWTHPVSGAAIDQLIADLEPSARKATVRL